ncbi:MAG: pirin family protein [Flavobacteriaceae bacterium]|nr:pirin family protein [Flavobacteriaceae bacterium]
MTKFPLGPTWQTQDPFLFCAYHLDHYPKGNDEMGPATPLDGRNLGSDFESKDGWRMYHGTKIPGFPYHPHRGFETVTLANKGYCDHSDSLGAAGRFGNGDVQWMTAGIGVQHSEMFPLLHTHKDNPLELLQLWLNLPRAKKFVQPHFKMLWKETIPELKDNGVQIKLIAGTYKTQKAPSAAPDSWASDENNHVRIMIIRLEPQAALEIDSIPTGINRSLYFFEGDSLGVNNTTVQSLTGLYLNGEAALQLRNGEKESRILILEGRPIGEPVAKYGPFVMNTDQEIREAMRDYGKTQFGGWPWPVAEQVHDRDRGRFALFPDGSLEEMD